MTVAVKALVFDIFGTVVDWHGSIVAEVQRLGLPIDGPAFALDWRAGYGPAMQEVRSGALPWMHIDALHRRILDRVLAERGITLPEAEAADLNRIWHRLKPWPDSVTGLTRLKSRHPIATLSNGNLSLLVAMARHAGLPWDAVLSAELFGHYKPDPEVYLGAARLLGTASQGRPPNLARATNSERLPLLSVVRVNLRLSRCRPGTLSGQGCRRCQTRLRSARAASSIVMPCSASRPSRMRRCNPSMGVHGSAPHCTCCMAGA